MPKHLNFGTSRHRAWVAAPRPLGGLMWSRGRRLGRLAAVFGPLGVPPGDLLRASCYHFGTTLEP
eukprot:9276308-Pyramimonas_sp.AAC.1